MSSPDPGSPNDAEDYPGRFDRFYAEAAPAVLSDEHARDAPPGDGSPRWPVTIVATVPDDVEDVLDNLTRQAVELAGDDHFQTGRRGSVHVTIRALEYFRPEAAPEDPPVPDYLAAMHRTVSAVRSVRLTLTGVTLTTSGVIAQLIPDNGFWDLQRTLRTELGTAGWREDGWERDLVYASLLHFTGPITDAAGLVGWVRDRRSLSPMTFELSTLALVRYVHRDEHLRPDDGSDAHRIRQMARQTWRKMPFVGITGPSRTQPRR